MRRLLKLNIWMVLSALASVIHADSSDPVYLIAAADIDGTTYREVAFMHERDIRELGQCERARRQGMMGRWQYYVHTSLATPGFSYSLTYFCAQGPFNLSKWTGVGERYIHVYEVDVTEGILKITAHDTYEECEVAVRASREESVPTHFCGKGSQIIRLP